MSRRKKKQRSTAPIYTFAILWLIMCTVTPVFKLGWLIAAVVIAGAGAYLAGRRAGKKAANEAASAEETEKGNRALSEMGRLYMSIKDPEIRQKINEIMRITDKITQDAIADPSDIPQIKKFQSYYIPTTIKLLNAYDRMSAQGIQGENLDKTMKSITEMLDTAIEAYKNLLDSLFANQALDIETDIDVMNKMLAREGLAGGKDFDI